MKLTTHISAVSIPKTPFPGLTFHKNRCSLLFRPDSHMVSFVQFRFPECQVCRQLYFCFL